MSTIREFRSDLPPMTEQAEDAARARLLAEIHAGVAPRPRRPRVSLGWRLALAATLAVAIGTGVIVADQRPRVVPVADVRELGERAAQAAYDDRGMTPNPSQWLYIKHNQAPGAGDGGFGVDLSKRTVFEEWTSVDGEQVAWETTPGGKLLIQGNHPGLSAADLAREPVTPEGVLAKIRAKLTEWGSKRVGEEPPPSMDAQLFQAIYQLMGTQALPPEVRAALFRGLATIPGVTYLQDVTDADGRKGIAFSHTDDWTRYDLILDPVDFRFLGTYGVTVKDKTMTYTDTPSIFVKAGTPLTLTARVEAKLVNAAGDR
ncbi:CU044_5270 family protein [Spongiactinospora sp. TRM90649]|uniref:CU044_5270 family protein n=1 Tax=Spongiactinospora sp. TRM90649 TaxID=3031114 RepID=UPI0023F9AB50|nr:CU044_5270 family protein [Spongiactinospora sp. TRM90649]MDF5751171.1 CU044_5270 family protein [Spongiactinospora sp. TRM90649]